METEFVGKFLVPVGILFSFQFLFGEGQKRFGVFLTSSAEHGRCSGLLTYQATEQTLPPGEELQFFPRNKASVQTLAGKEEMAVEVLL